MNDGNGWVRVVEPEMTQRRCGGWLAVTPRYIGIRIGAVGDSAEEARANFAALTSSWAKSREEELLINQPAHYQAVPQSSVEA